MSDLDDLYQQLIIDHSKRPRNYGPLDCANRHAEGFNPLCGDHVTVYLLIEGDQVRDIRFSGAGCAICTAAASLMTDSLKGKTVDQVRKLFEAFHDLVTGQGDTSELGAAELGKLAVFSGVRKYPIRVKCASLPWHTVKAALESGGQPVTTE